MNLIISLFLEHLEYLHPEVEGMSVHGASLSTAALLQRCAGDPEVVALEVFLPLQLMARPTALAEAARTLLGPGRSFLRFHPVHAVTEVWADRRPRILLCMDPETLLKHRYLRDRFAPGPMAICCDTHNGESRPLIAGLTRLANARPVPYDAIVCLDTRQQVFMRALIADLAPATAPSPLRLELIPRGVDSERFRPADAAERTRARLLLGLPEHGRIVLFFGRLNAYTKADLLPVIDAFVAASPADDHLLIVGREYPAGYSALLREAGNGLGHRLIIRKEAPPSLRPLYYAASDLFVLPGDTIIEAFSNTVLEAMACGLPVIASDWVGISDLVEDGVSGILIPTWWMPGLDRVSALSPLAQPNADHLATGQSLWVDAGALADAMRRLLNAPETCTAMGAAGRRRAENHAAATIHGRWRRLWEAQLAEAAVEPASTAAMRRAGADQLGQPSRYLAWYGHYASGVISPTHRFRLNERGRTVAVRVKPVRFYDDLLPLIHRDLLDALFAVLSEQAEWATCEDLVKRAALRTPRMISGFTSG